MRWRGIDGLYNWIILVDDRMEFMDLRGSFGMAKWMAGWMEEQDQSAGYVWAVQFAASFCFDLLA